MKITNLKNTPPVGEIQFLTDIPGDNYSIDKKIKNLAHKYRHIETIILVGNGGSINTFRGIYQALRTKNTPKVYFVDTNEPEYLEAIKEEINYEKSLLLSISQSGENLSQLEATIYFWEIPHKIFLTGKKTPLRDIAKKNPEIEVLDHFVLSGRFSGLTTTGLLPAALCGFNFEALRNTYKENFDKLQKDAWTAAVIIWEMEQQNSDTLYILIYSKLLSGFNLFIQQIIHETLAKNNKGITVLSMNAPEAQHHTIQRILNDKRKNPVFTIETDHRSEKLMIADELKSIEVKNKKIFDLSKRLDTSIKIEAKVIKESLEKKNIPQINFQNPKVDESSISDFIVFWHLFSIFGANLRQLDPFAQPDVQSVKSNILKSNF